MSGARIIGYIGGLILALALTWGTITAAPTDTDKEEPILVELSVERKATFDFDALLIQDQLYVPLLQLLECLDIHSSYSDSELTIAFPFPQKPQKIDFIRGIMRDSNMVLPFSPEEVLRMDDEIYLKSEHIAQLLEFELDFNYRSLRLTLYSAHSLPVLNNLERKERYTNFIAPAAAPPPSSSLGGQHHLINGMAADWSLRNSHSPHSTTHSYRLGAGGHVLGGDLNLMGAGSFNERLDRHQLKGRWRYPFYSSSFIKQVQAGDLSRHSRLGPEPFSFRGISISNRPLAPRRIFSTFMAEGRLSPGWDSELYSNNRLSAFAMGDLDSYYRFTTPLHYGSNFIKHYTYAPTGERALQKEYLIHIPQDFLPPGTFQYTFSAGRYQSVAQDFGRADLQWGVSSRLTLGGGSSITRGDGEAITVPYLQAGLRPANHVTASVNHAFGQLTEGILRGSWAGAQSLNLSAKKFYQNSFYNRTQKDLELISSLSFPVAFSNIRFSSFGRGRYTRYKLQHRAFHLFGGIRTRLPLGLGWRINNRILFNGYSGAPLHLTQWDVDSQLTRRIRRILLRPSLKYNYRLGRLTEYRLQAGIRITPASFLDMTFQHNALFSATQLFFNFRLNLPFARHSSMIRSTGGSVSGALHTYGSIGMYDSRSPFIDNQRRVGRAGIRIKAFLDLNNNGKQDTGETDVQGLTGDLYRPGQLLAFRRGNQLFDSLVPYEHYTVQINQHSLQNPLWRAASASYSVQALPNIFTTLTVPVVVSGEISGSLHLDQPSPIPLYGLNIEVLDFESTPVTTLTTYGDGRFYFVGLKPGRYIAVIDQRQLKARGLAAGNKQVSFAIKTKRHGDIVEDIVFQIMRLP